MSTLAMTVMTVICGIVWGGFITLIVRAVRSEALKSSEAVKSRGPSSP